MILGFVIGLFVGSIAGVLVMGLCAANGRICDICHVYISSAMGSSFLGGFNY